MYTNQRTPCKGLPSLNSRNSLHPLDFPVAETRKEECYAATPWQCRAHQLKESPGLRTPSEPFFDTCV